MPFFIPSDDKPNESEESAEMKVPEQLYQAMKNESLFFAKKAKHNESALEKLTKVLEMNPKEKACLLARAHCYINLGMHEPALADCNAALETEEDATSHRNAQAIYMKAEVLFNKGDFETALIFYHRGRRMCMNDLSVTFALGITKCEQAINNSIATPKAVSLRKKKWKGSFDERKYSMRMCLPSRINRGVSGLNLYPGFSITPVGANRRQLSQLLGPLYPHYAFFETLQKNLSPDHSSSGSHGHKEQVVNISPEISKVAGEAVKFLSNRAEFWREQKPLYAQKRDRRKLLHSSRAHLTTGDPMCCLLQQLEKIDQGLEDGDYKGSLKRAKKVLSRLLSYGDKFVQKRMGLLALLYNSMGTACLELGLLEQALNYHNMDLQIGQISGAASIRTRAMENIAKTKARMGRYEEAVQAWSEQIHKVRTETELAWMHHELGHCLLKLNRYTQAKEEALMSLQIAQKAHHRHWQMHALVLLAEAEWGLEETQEVKKAFEKAWNVARKLKDLKAQEAIQEVLMALTGYALQERGGDTDEDKEQEEEGGREPNDVPDMLHITKEEDEQSTQGKSTADSPNGQTAEDEMEDLHSECGGRVADPLCWEKQTKEQVSKQKRKPENMHVNFTSEAYKDTRHSHRANAQTSTKSSLGVKLLKPRTASGLRPEKTTAMSDAVQNRGQDTKDRMSATRREGSLGGGASPQIIISSTSEDINNSVTRSVETKAPSTPEESMQNVVTDAMFKCVSSHASLAKRNSRIKDTSMQSSRDVGTSSITFQLNQVSRPQTANLVRPKLTTGPRPQTAKQLTGKLAKTKPPPSRPDKRIRTYSVDRFKDIAIVSPPPVFAELPDPDSCIQHSDSPSEDSDHLSPDVHQQGNNSYRSASQCNLFNVSSSESSDERPVLESDHVQTSGTSVPNEHIWNANCDDRHHGADIFSDNATEDKFLAVSDTSAGDAIKRPNNCAQGFTSGFTRPQLSKSSGDRPKSNMSMGSRSCYSLPRSPLRIGSDTHVLQAGFSRPNSSSNVFYSDSRIKNWVTDVLNSFSSLGCRGNTQSEDTDPNTCQLTLLTPDYSLVDPGNRPQHLRSKDGQHQDTLSPETTEFEQSTSQPRESTAAESQSQDGPVSGSETDFNKNCVQSRQRSISSSGGSFNASGALVDPNKPQIKGTRKKSAASYTALAGRNSASSGKVSFPASASACPKSITADIIQQVYDPRGLSIQSTAGEKGRPNCKKMQQFKLLK